MHRKRKTRVCYTVSERCNWKRADHSRGVKQSGFIWNLKQRRILQNLVTTTSGKEFSEFDKQTKTCFHLLTPQKVIFFPLEFHLKYLGFILEHTNQGHTGVIYHLFTTELLLCHAPTVVQPGNSANAPSRRGAPIRAFIILWSAELVVQKNLWHR